MIYTWNTTTEQINAFRMIWRCSDLWSHCVFPSEGRLWTVDWGMTIAMRYSSWVDVEIDLWSLQIPKNCSSTMMFDLFYRIVPRDLTQTPIHINTFLPVFTLTGKNKLRNSGNHGSSMKLCWMNRLDAFDVLWSLQVTPLRTFGSLFICTIIWNPR